MILYKPTSGRINLKLKKESAVSIYECKEKEKDFLNLETYTDWLKLLVYFF